MRENKLFEIGPTGAPFLWVDRDSSSDGCESNKATGRTKWTESTTKLLHTTKRSVEHKYTVFMSKHL